MLAGVPPLEQFRVEEAHDGLIHFAFDAPGRTMNVFSNAAIRELGVFAHWLRDAKVRGVVVCSGKANAFCAGADLNELGVAYDMIVSSKPQDAFGRAFDHFFPLSQAIRHLETAGKPVAAAIGGLALGGGCELAMGCHYRVLAEHPKTGMGLPESLVGLLPGAGGTQRMPRLVGVDLALDILLDGRQLAGREALDAGLIHQLVVPGEEVAAAEAWLLDQPHCVQPWDQQTANFAERDKLLAVLDRRRAAVLASTLGHYPAPLAILDCVEHGLRQPIDVALRTEMAVFSLLIQRPEARNMIQTLFLGKLDYDKAARSGALPPHVAQSIDQLATTIEKLPPTAALASAGFRSDSKPRPVRSQTLPGYWLDSDDPAAQQASRALGPLTSHAANLGASLTPDERRLADYAIHRRTGFPAYLGGPFALAASRA